jgi:hypothetical protein
MATVLPPLTALIDQGTAGGHEFERLMHQLLIEDGKRQGYAYEPVSGADGDGGIDRKSSHKTQIQDSLQRAARHSRAARHWVLVTPWDLTPSERDWLTELEKGSGLHVHHWRQVRIENLLRGFPPLFARYYPHEAQALPGGQGSVEFRPDVHNLPKDRDCAEHVIAGIKLATPA